MRMTITEKIMAKAANRSQVSPGETIWLDVDILMTHDVCGPPTIDIWKKEFGEKAKIWDKNKLVIFPDHYIFTDNEHARRNVSLLHQFAEEHQLPHFYDVDSERYKGVCHVSLAEEGFNLPGSVLIGTDSHTCTSGAFGLFATGVGNTDAAFIMGTGKLWEKVPPSIKFVFEGEMPAYLMAKDLILKILGDLTTNGGTYCALEFVGETITSLNMFERMSLTNMAIEVGAMNGIIAADEVTAAYIKDRSSADYEIFRSDDDATYSGVYSYRVTELQPLLAKPHSPDNVAPVAQVQGTPLTKCYLGSCTGGKIYDFEAAAKVLYGNQVNVPTYIVPSTTFTAQQLEAVHYKDLPLRMIFELAGCIVTPPSCAACLGGPADTVGRAVDHDVVISTTNRNFPGRMGSKKAEVYLASPLTVAASAVRGVITDPRDFII